MIRGNLLGMAAVAGAAGLAAHAGMSGSDQSAHHAPRGAASVASRTGDPTTPQELPAASNAAPVNGTVMQAAVQTASAPVATPPADCVRTVYGAVGVPEVVGSDSENVILCRMGYAASFDPRTRDPDWVIEHVPAAQISGPASRGNKFMADPDLGAAGSQLADYARSGYDRGHQAPAGDFKSSQALMDQSFYLSNMAPQVGIGFNRGEWAYLEGTVRCWLKGGVVSDVYIITGPVYGQNPPTIGPDHVVVPQAFFKIVYDPSRQRAIGFELPNVKTATQTVANFVTPISQIEEETGLTFLPAVQANLFKGDKPAMWANEDKCAGGDAGG